MDYDAKTLEQKSDQNELIDKKEYRYRKHIVWGQYIIPIFFAAFIICLWAVPLLIAKIPVSERLLSGITTFSLILVIEGAFLWFLYYRLAGIRIIIGENEIIYKNRRGEITIPFTDITRLEFPSIRYCGGWLKIISNKKTIRLTVVIQDIGGLLQDLKKALDNKGLSSCYDREKMYRFFKTSAYSDQSWDRLYKKFGKFILIFIVNCILCVLYRLFIKLNILWSITLAFWPVLVYLYTELIFGRLLAKGADEETFTCPEPDTATEKEIYKKAIIFGGIIYLLIFAIACFNA